MPAVISSRLIVTSEDQRDGVWESTDCENGWDVSSLDDASLARVEAVESKGIGFVVTGYLGRLADLNVAEDTRRRLIPVASLGLSVRSMNCLRAGGISTAGELLEQTTEGLLSIPNMGQKSVSEIRERLSELGLSGSGSRWKRTLDLRLLFNLIDIDPELAPIISRAGYSLVWEVCAATSVALRNRLGTKSALQQLERALERVGVPLYTVIPKWLRQRTPRPGWRVSDGDGTCGSGGLGNCSGSQQFARR
jgi:hypothetical protein